MLAFFKHGLIIVFYFYTNEFMHDSIGTRKTPSEPPMYTEFLALSMARAETVVASVRTLTTNESPPGSTTTFVKLPNLSAVHNTCDLPAQDRVETFLVP